MAQHRCLEDPPCDAGDAPLAIRVRRSKVAQCVYFEELRVSWVLNKVVGTHTHTHTHTDTPFLKHQLLCDFFLFIILLFIAISPSIKFYYYAKF